MRTSPATLPREIFRRATRCRQAFGGLYDAFVAKLNSDRQRFGILHLVRRKRIGCRRMPWPSMRAATCSWAARPTPLNLPLVGAIQSANNGGSVGWLARMGVTAPPPQIPSAVSVTPSSGSGNTVVFSAQYSDSGGAVALTAVSLLVNTSASTAFACYVTYNRVADVLSLANDDPATGSQVVTFGGGSQQNSQCIVNGAGSSVSLAGSTLTLNISLTFQPGFAVPRLSLFVRGRRRRQHRMGIARDLDSGHSTAAAFGRFGVAQRQQRRQPDLHLCVLRLTQSAIEPDRHGHAFQHHQRQRHQCLRHRL